MPHSSRPRRARTAPSPQAPSPHGPSRPRPRRAAPALQTSDGPTAPALAIEVRQDLHRPLVTVSGELDMTSAGLVTAMLEHVRRGRRRPGGEADVVDLDLSGVTFADSHGLAPALDGRTRIVAASPPVRRLRRLLHELADGPSPRVA